MRIDKFTNKAQEALRDAQSIAASSQQQAVQVPHLVLALIKQDEGVVPALLDKIGVPQSSLLKLFEEEVARLPKVSGGQAYMATDLQAVLTQAEQSAAEFKDDYVSTEHLFLAAVKSNDEAGKVLKQAGLKEDNVLKALATVRGSHRVTDQSPENRYQALMRYGTDLTQRARQDAVRHWGLCGGGDAIVRSGTKHGIQHPLDGIACDHAGVVCCCDDHDAVLWPVYLLSFFRTI